MFVALVLLIIATGTAVVAAYWYFLAGPVVRAFRRNQPPPKFRFSLLQANLVLIIAEILLTRSIGAWLFPPLAIYWYSGIILDYWILFRTPLAWSVISAGIVFAFLAVVFRRRFWYFAPAIITATLCAVFLVKAARISAAEQFAAIARLNPDCAFPGDFFRSLRIAKQEFKFDYHFLVFKDEKAFGWSFAQMGFYPIGTNIVKNLNGAKLGFERCYGKSPAWDAAG